MTISIQPRRSPSTWPPGRSRATTSITPNESWDWDEVSPPILVDYKRDGRTIKGLVDVARNGYLWYLERSDGKIGFVEGMPYVKQNVFKSLDPKTGRPDVDPARKPGIGKMADFCPSWQGGKNWLPVAYSPKTRMIYIPTQREPLRRDDRPERPVRRRADASPATTNTMYIAPGADHISEVQAWNVDTGKKAWTHNFAKSPNWGPMLATAGGLVFSGGTNDRKFRAFDASTGELLWEFPTNSGVTRPPRRSWSTASSTSRCMSGWGHDARAMQARINAVSLGKFPEVPEGGVIWVFAVK